MCLNGSMRKIVTRGDSFLPSSVTLRRSLGSKSPINRIEFEKQNWLDSGSKAILQDDETSLYFASTARGGYEDTMKKVLAICLIVLLLCGCSRIPKNYPFENKNEPIESVELLYYPWYEDRSKPIMEFELMRTLSPDEIPEFMNKLYALETTKAFPPPSNYGLYVARVNYKNGDSEYFGARTIEFVKSGKDACAIGGYCFTGNGFDMLFFEYAWN